ncbi:MAG TPA: NUDIX domain-containing protein [Candidatus Saccharimonadales bacterium]|nr:NUDIX domain-containing protein [Candidatus Saccharimonadales bacterium]
MKIQIVDKNDNLIGAKERTAVDYSKDIYRISALWLTNSKGEILLAQRQLTKDKDPGLWGPAAVGTLDEGETYESNMQKEAKEEICLTGIKFKIGPKVFVQKPRFHFCQWYFAVCDWPVDKFKIQKEEVAQLKWVAPADLKDDLKSHPENYVSQMPIVVEKFV